MTYLEQVQRGIDYIECHLEYELSVDAVAREAGISRWHFQRIFKAMTNETLKTYIRSRRLALSLQKLMSSDQRILDIALAAGYETQESYTRAFKQAFGMTPGDFRKIGDKNLFPLKVRIDSDYLQHIHKGVSLVPELRQQPAMTLVGMKTGFYGVDSEKNNIADRLPPLWQSFLQRLQEVETSIGGTCYGIIQQTMADSERLDYYAAVAVHDSNNLPDGMVRVDIPESRYAFFEHRGEVLLIDSTVNYIYSSWLLNSGHRHTCGPDLEVYGADYHPVSAESVMGYAIPIG